MRKASERRLPPSNASPAGSAPLILTLLGVAPTVLLEIGTDDVTALEEGAKKLSSKMIAIPEILRICIRLLNATTAD